MPGENLIGGGMLDDPSAGDLLEGPVLELEVDRPEKRSRKASRAGGKKPEQSPEETAAKKKQAQLRQISGYGEMPAKPIGYPFYALRVLWRQYRLRSELKELDRRRQQPNEEMTRALKAAGEAMYVKQELAGREPFGEKIRAVGAADHDLDELKSGREQARASTVEQMKETVRAVEETQQKAAPLRGEENRLLEELRQNQAILQELRAKDRKTEEEHSALVQNTIGKPDAGWQAAVESEREKRRSEIAAAQSEVDERDRQLQTVRGKLVDIRSEVDALNERRKSFAEIRAQDEQKFESRAGEVQKSREAALVELGRLGMEQRLPGVADCDFERGRRALAVLAEIDRNRQLRREALPTYQKRPFRAGLGLLAAALALLIALYSGISALRQEEEPYQWEYLEKEQQQ